MKLGELIDRAKFTVQQWGKLSGKRPTLIRDWAGGRYIPEDDNLEALAAAAEEHAATLRDVAAGLRRLKSSPSAGREPGAGGG